MNNTFVLLDLDVIRLRASQGDPEAEVHVKWSLDYDIHPPTSEDGSLRIVFGTLHAGGPFGWGDVTVASRYSAARDVAFEGLEAAIKASSATESLYDFARSQLAPLLATVGATLDLPRKAPEAVLTSFDPNEEIASGEHANMEGEAAG